MSFNLPKNATDRADAVMHFLRKNSEDLTDMFVDLPDDMVGLHAVDRFFMGTHVSQDSSRKISYSLGCYENGRRNVLLEVKSTKGKTTALVIHGDVEEFFIQAEASFFGIKSIARRLSDAFAKDIPLVDPFKIDPQPFIQTDFLCAETFSKVHRGVKDRSRTIRHFDGSEVGCAIDPNSNLVAAFKPASPYEYGNFYGLGVLQPNGKVDWIATGRSDKRGINIDFGKNHSVESASRQLHKAKSVLDFVA